MIHLEPAAVRVRAPAGSAPAIRWSIAILVTAAIVLSYLDRLTLPWTLSEIRREYPFSDQIKALFDSAFLVAYGFMYLGGGWLLDRLGTRRGFLLVMLFWSLACVSQGFAGNYGLPPVFGLTFSLAMLVASRFLLGMGEGGGFPAATRVVSEWFPVNERSTAMGLINAGTAVGAVAAPWLIWLVLDCTGWMGITPWRWVFILSGGLGIGWTLWWNSMYHSPETHPRIGEAERALILGSTADDQAKGAASLPLATLLSRREIRAVVVAKFLTDAAWYFYMFWLPKYLMERFHLEFSATSSVGWIPYAAAGIGCMWGGGLSSWLLRRELSVNASRKIALGLSVAFMPWVVLVPGVDSLWGVVAIFSLAFFGQQSWSTLVMTLPTDLVPKHSVGTVAGLVGFGGAMGGIVLGQVAGYLRDHGASFTPILIIAGSLHVLAFVLICVGVPRLRLIEFQLQPSSSK